jgi:tetratricopeptide (TPR) repeat protein
MNIAATTNAPLCPRCQTAQNESSHFCAACGWDLGKAYLRYSLGMRSAAVVLVAATVLWGGASFLTNQHAGNKPTQAYVPPEAQPVQDQTLNPLREAAQSRPDDIMALRNFADALVTKIRSTEKPDTGLLFEAMEVLAKILSVNPQEAPALLALADISFNQQVFDKAVTYYERYLALAPGDHPVRARMASALTFLGKADLALKELQAILAQSPNDFHALAYTSITHAQTGNSSEALKWGEKALAAAPSIEARDRFGEFLTSLKTSAAAPETKMTSEQLPPLAAFEKSIRNNPVAGPKFVRLQAEGQILRLYFKEFPMSAMPEVARQKFIGGLQSKLKELKLSVYNQLEFIDADTGSKLATAPAAN